MRSLRVLAVLALWAGLGAIPGIAEDGDPILVLDTGGHTSTIWNVTFTPDGSQLISSGYDKVIRIWEVSSGSIVRTIRGQISPGEEGQIYTSALSPDGDTLAVAGWLAGPPSQRRAIRLHRVSDGSVLALLQGHQNVIHSLAFSPDGRRLASGSSDKTVRLWKRTGSTWTQERVLKGHQDRVVALAFSPDGARLVSGSYDHTARLWNVADGELVRDLRGHKDWVRAVAFSLDGKMLLTGSSGGEIRRWDPRNGEARGELGRQTREVMHLAFSPRGDRVVAGAGSGTGSYASQVFAVPSGRIVSQHPHTSIIFSVDFSPKDRLVASAGGKDERIAL